MPVPEGALASVPGGIQIQVKAVPGASRSRIVGWLGDHLKIAVAAPPEGGKANKAICEVLAAALGVRPQDVQVTAGMGNPRKKVFVGGLTVELARQRLASDGT
jgi:uncharacterized protein (TIGR00251 family)